MAIQNKKTITDKAPETITDKAPETITDKAPETITDKAPETITDKSSGKIFIASAFPRAIDFRIPDSSGVDCRIIIEGNAAYLRGKDKGVVPIGGFGLTAIDQEVWNKIEEKYQHLPVIKNGVIFATTGDRRFAEDMVAERTDVRHGFEPVDPKKTNTEPATKEE